MVRRGPERRRRRGLEETQTVDGRSADRMRPPAGAGALVRREEQTMALDLVPLWAVILPSPCSCTCCSTASISASACCSRCAATSRPRPDDGLARAGLGLQRDLADPRRRRPAGGVPAGLRHRHPGALLPDPRHAARRCCFAAWPSSSASVEGERRWLWDRGFVIGSLLATFAQGVVLGNFISAFRCRGASSPAPAGTGSSPFRCSPASGWSSAMRCRARPGW